MSRDREAVWAVVTPVFEDGESFASLCRDLGRLDAGVALEVLAVDDGTIGAAPAVDAIRDAGMAGRIVRLKRNSGHQTAIWVGLAVAASEPRYAGAIVMDSDGEDRPGNVPQLVAAVGTDCNAVVAQRGRRTESLSFRLFYRLYRRFFRLLTGREIRFGNFCALDRRALLRLTAMQETRIHLAAALIKSRLRRVECEAPDGFQQQPGQVGVLVGRDHPFPAPDQHLDDIEWRRAMGKRRRQSPDKRLHGAQDRQQPDGMRHQSFREGHR